MYHDKDVDPRPKYYIVKGSKFERLVPRSIAATTRGNNNTTPVNIKPGSLDGESVLLYLMLLLILISLFRTAPAVFSFALVLYNR